MCRSIMQLLKKLNVSIIQTCNNSFFYFLRESIEKALEESTRCHDEMCQED